MTIGVVWLAEARINYGPNDLQREEFIGAFADRESAIRYVENDWPNRDTFFEHGMPERTEDGWGRFETWISLWQSDVIAYSEIGAGI